MIGRRSVLRANGERGQGLLEFALVVPIILLLLMGLFDLGRLIYAYNTVSEAARNGGRVAIVNQTVADIRGTAAGRAIALGIPSSCPASGPGVCVTFTDPPNPPALLDCPNDPDISCIATVTVRYNFKPLTPIIGPLVAPAGITVSSASALPIERRCNSADSTTLFPGEAACPIP